MTSRPRDGDPARDGTRDRSHTDSLDWERALSDLEAEMTAYELALSTDDVPVLPPYDPPSDLSVLPPSLHPRAQALVARARTLTAFARCRLLAVSGDIGHTRRGREGTGTGNAALAIFLDTSA